MSLHISASGMRNAAERQGVRANNVANLQTPGFRAARPGSPVTPDAAVRSNDAVVPGSGSDVLPPSDVDLTVELTGSLLDVRDNQANAAAFRAQDEVLREVLDIKG